MNEATFENDATTSDFDVAPTLMADEIQPGALSALVNPLLPAAITEATPDDRSVSMIGLVGSLSHGEVKPDVPPTLSFAADTVRDPMTAFTRSRPAMMSEVHASAQGGEPPHALDPVNCEKTMTDMICAPFATPENATPAAAPFPAAMPATWVPCQHPDSGQGAPAPGPVCCVEPFGHMVMLCPGTLLE